MRGNKISHKPFGFKFTGLRLRNLKSQAAVEFLATYSWAILSLMITLSALYYFGIFDFSKYLPEKCIFTSQLECIAFVMGESDIRIKLVNNLGETITVESMTISNNADPPLSCTISPTFPISVWIGGDEMEFLFQGCSGGGYLKGERVDAKSSLTYYAENTPSQPRHTVNGKLHGRVS